MTAFASIGLRKGLLEKVEACPGVESYWGDEAEDTQALRLKAAQLMHSEFPRPLYS